MYDAQPVSAAVARARRAQGVVEGKLAALGPAQRQVLTAEAWTQEAMSTAAIEGEPLDLIAVRSSVARRLGVAGGKGPNAPRHVDGLLDIMDDAVTNAGLPVAHQRLQAWQAALFPPVFPACTALRSAPTAGTRSRCKSSAEPGAVRHMALSPRQRKAMNVLLDAGPGGFGGGISTRKYESLGPTPRATATRELAGLAALGLLRVQGGGRSTRYYINLDGWDV